MRPTAVPINVARVEIVHEEALCRALTHEVAGWIEGTVEARAKLIEENIRPVAHGERPVNLAREALPGR